MAISIDWLTKVIYVPKSDLTLVQLTPTEIRELDLNWFRLQLKDLEDSEEGMVSPDTHNHNTEVMLGGLTYARIIEIINGYTVTFEDGQYAVNLVGANSNVGDVVNVNQVSVRVSNSAGLISSPAIEYSSYMDGVTIDVNSSYAGTVFPIGTPQQPVNNLDDAILIAEYRGFSVLYFRSNFTFAADDYITGYTLVGFGIETTTLTFTSGCIMAYCKVRNAKVTGRALGIIGYLDSYVYDFGATGQVPSSAVITLRSCLIGGTIYVPSNFTGTLITMDCWSDPGILSPPILNLNYAHCNSISRNYSGILKFENYNWSDGQINMDITSGQIIVDETVTSGTIIFRGVGTLINNSNEAIIDSTGLVSQYTVVDAIQTEIGPQIEYSSFEGAIWVDILYGGTGTEYPMGTPQSPVNNIEDALLIASSRGFRVISFVGDYTFPGSTFLSGVILSGQGFQLSTFTFETGAIVYNCDIRKATVWGEITGVSGLYDCLLEDCGSTTTVPSEGEIVVINSFVNGRFYLPTVYSGTISALGCWAYSSGVNIPTLDMCNCGADIRIRNFSGQIRVANVSQDNDINVGMSAGSIELMTSVSGGIFTVEGVGVAVNNSTSTLYYNEDGLISKASVVNAIQTEIGSEIEYSSYNGGVTIDTVSGTESVTYPYGTPAYPCKTLFDVLTIAGSRGFRKVYVLGDLTVSGVSSNCLTGYEFMGGGQRATTITIDDSRFINCIFRDCNITGYFGNGSYITTIECSLEDLFNVTLDAHESIFRGVVELNNTIPSNFYNCVDGIPGVGVPEIQLTECESLGIWNWQGGIRLTQITTPGTVVSAMITAGRLFVDETDTEGNIIVKGMANLVGITGGTTIDSTGLVSMDTMSVAVWDEPIGNHTTLGTIGASTVKARFNGMICIDMVNGVSGTAFPAGTHNYPVNNFDDAMSLNAIHGFNEFGIHGAVVLDREFSDAVFKGGVSFVHDSIDFNGQSLYNVRLESITTSGSLNGTGITFFDCYIVDVQGLCGETVGGRLSGSNTIAPGDYFSGIEIVVETDFTILDLQNNPDTTISLDVNSGIITFMNAVDTCLIELNLRGGEIVVDASCVGGELYLEGYGTLYNESNMTILENHLLALESLSEVTSNAVWEHASGTAVVSNVEFIKGIEGGRWRISNNQMIFYGEDNTTEIARFNLYNRTGVPSEEYVFDRQRV